MMHAALIAALAWAGTDSSQTFRLSLRQAMDAAKSGGYQAELARSRADELQGKIGEARGALLPHVGATATDIVRSFDLPAMGLSFPSTGGAPVFPNLIKPFNAQDARVNGRFSLINATEWKNYSAAKTNAEEGALNAAAAEETASLSAAEAYLALARARALLDSRRAELVLANQLSDLSRAQQQAGGSTRIEVLRADGQVSSAKSALSAAEGNEERARYALLRSLNMGLDAMPVLSDTLSLHEGSREEAGASDATVTETLPEIAAADKRRESARTELGAMRSEFIPTLDLSGDYGLSGRRLNDRAEWTEDIALQLTWNIWDGGRRRARLAEQKEKVKQADLAGREARSAAQEMLREAGSAMRTLRDEAANARDRVGFAEEEEKLAREKFRSGASGNLEVISAQGSVSQAHEAYIDALYGFNRARLEYLRAAHRLAEL